MPTQSEKAALFRALHEKAGAFVIPNPWDAGSAPHPGRPRLPGARHFERRLGRHSRQARRQGDAGRGAGAGARDRRSHRPPGVGRPGKRIRRLAAGGGRNHPSCRGRRPGRRLDRGRDRRQGQAALRHRPRDRAHRGGGAGRARAAIPVHADRARGEFPARQSRPRRHDQAPAGVRKSRCRRAVRPRPSRPRGRAHGLLQPFEAVQFHGRHPRKILHVRRTRRRRASSASASRLRFIARR